MQEKVSFMGFSVQMEIFVPRDNCFGGTRLSIVTRQTQLSLETGISIHTSNPWKILIFFIYNLPDWERSRDIASFEY